MIHWFVLTCFYISLALICIWLCIAAPWRLHPWLVPKIQHQFWNLLYPIFWYSHLAVTKMFSLPKLKGAPIGCHKVAPLIQQSNSTHGNIFEMESVAKLISLPTRPHRSFYFFAPFIYPFLPLDFIGNKCEAWNRVYASFNHIMIREKVVSRSEQITIKYAMKLAEELKMQGKENFKIKDRYLRDMICAIMWELVFGSEPKESDVKIIAELTQIISSSLTYNMDPDWSGRIELCTLFLEKIHSHADVQTLENEFKLTKQELCTVYGMEFFVTPALEIGEVMTNLIAELANKDNDLVQRVSYDADLMRYAITVTAHHYPVLQVIMREVSCPESYKDLTKCINLISGEHVLEIQAQIIAEANKNRSVFNDIINYSSVQNADRPTISDVETCMAFGKGQRVCKGKELSIKMISSFLRTIYDELGQWPIIEITAGRKFTAFYSFDLRLYRWYRRWMIANVHYHCDKLLRRPDLYRFQWQP